MSKNILYTLLLGVLLLSFPNVDAQYIDKGDVSKAQESINKRLSEQPAVFTQNRGQWENNILFRTQYENTNIYFTEKGLSFGLRKMWEGDIYNPDGTIAKPGEAPAKFEYLVWDLNYINSNSNSTWESSGEVKSNVNYFTNSDGDRPVLGTYDYSKIINKNVYENIDVHYYLNESKLKYDYIVRPQGDINAIQLEFDGIKDLKLDESGKLVITTKWGEYKKTIPYSYQIIDGVEVEVEVEFVLLEEDNSYGFKVKGEYDKEFDLVIDPVYIDWGSYFYGGGKSQSQWTYSWTWVRDVDVDEDNYVYVTGMTTDKFPTDPGWYDTSFNGNYDGFLCKMKFDGTDIEWFSYIGGAGWDYLVSIRVTDAGEVFAIGTSSSTNFPVTNNAYDKTNKNSTSGWWYGGSYVLLSMNTQGTRLNYSTFLNTGTTNSNYYYSWWLYNYPIEVNEQGEVFVALNFSVGNLTLPVKSYLLPQGFYTNPNTFANSASIILKMNSDGSDILNSTLFGGAGNDAIFGLYLNDTGLLYIGSSTTSTNIPATKGVPGFGTLPVGNGDGHIAIMDTGFTNFSVSKYIGGTGDDKIVALYGSDDGIYMLLETTSTKILGYTNTAGGGTDAAVIKIRPDGIKAIWGTFLGGSNREYPKGITANIREEVIVVGQTYSNNYPVTSDAFKKTAGSNWGWAYNGFLTKLNYEGTPIYSTYIGGSGVDFLMGVTTKRIGCVTHIVVGGYTTSTDFHITEGAWRDSVRTRNNNGW